MAKRRINQKFLAILTAVAVLIGGLGVAAYKLRDTFFPKHPEKYIAIGREALQRQDYAAARDNFAKAASMARAGAELDVLLGDSLNGLGSVDPDNVLAARNLWETALTVDPNYIPALERLVSFWHDELELRTRSQERTSVAAQLEKAAQRLLDSDPDNKLGRSSYAEAVIEQLTLGAQKDPKLVTKAREILVRLASDDPTDADLPFYLARADIWAAQDAERQTDPERAQQSFDSAAQVMAAAVQAAPDNAVMHFRYGQILLQIASNLGAAKDPTAEVKEMVVKAAQEIDLARQTVQADDPRYIEVSLFGARFALNRPEYAPPPAMPRGSVAALTPAPAGATGSSIPGASPVGSIATALPQPASRVRVVEAIYRDVLAHHPENPEARLGLADLLGNLPGRREEAIALLKQPLTNDNAPPGVKGTLLPFFQAQVNIRLLALEIDDVEATRDAAKRGQLLAAADTLCETVYGRNPDSPVVLGLKGRLQLVHGEVVDATQTLRKALALTDPNDSAGRLSRYELMFNLARACEAAQQTGDAKKLATEVASVYSHFIPARLMLARLLVSEHDFDAARPQVDFLESILPEHPELANIVSRLRIATLDPVQNAPRIKQYYDTLPEGTRDQMMDKAAFARIVKYDSEVLRLVSLVHQRWPADVEATHLLVLIYNAAGNKAKAADIVNESLVANPSDSALLAMQMQLQESTPGTTTQPGDAFNAEWAQVQVHRVRGDLAGVDEHLAAAEKLRPNDPRIWDACFSRALETSDWDRASAYADKLAAANIDRAGGVLYRIRYWLARDDASKASDLALQLTRDKPEFAQSWCVLGQVQKAQQHYPEAIASYQQALQRQTQNLDAIRGIVECAYALSDTNMAKQYIDMGRRVAPGDPTMKELAINYEMTYGDPRNVIVDELAAQQAAPDDPQTWFNLIKAYLAAATSRTKAQDATGAADYNQKADDLLRRAIARWPDKSFFVTTYAKAQLDRGDYPSAEDAMLNFAQLPDEKGTAAAAYLLGEFYELAGKQDAAVSAMSDYLAHPQKPGAPSADIRVESRLAGLLTRMHRYDDAITALSANAQDPAIEQQKAQVLITAGRLADARHMLDALAAAGPLNADLLGIKGSVALSAGDLAEARSCFDQVLALQANNRLALTERAQTALRSSPPDYAQAMKDLSRARDLDPADVDTRLNLVNVDLLRGRSDEAIAELESALRAAPTDKRVRLQLINLYASAQPPRWEDADRLLSDAHKIPSLSDDLDLMREEAAVDLSQDSIQRANELITAALQRAPNNLSIIHTYYDVLLRAKQYDQLLSHSSQLLAATPNQPSMWWVYPYRAQALVQGNSDRAGAQAELDSGLAAAIAAKDVRGTGQLIGAFASLLGPDIAIKVAADHADNDPHFLVLAARVAHQKGDPDAALSWIGLAMGKLAQLSQADQLAVLGLGARENLLKTPPDPVKSAALYRELLKLNPADIDALNNFACVLMEPGPAYQPHEALEASEKAYNLMISAGNDQPMVKDTYGWALILNGRSEDGLNVVQDALSKLDFPEGHYHVAEALLKRQPPNAEDAATELGKASRLLERDEQEGKPVDLALRLHVQEELKRARSALAG
jgi:predicted Zn-dependent protease